MASRCAASAKREGSAHEKTPRGIDEQPTSAERNGAETGKNRPQRERKSWRNHLNAALIPCQQLRVSRKHHAKRLQASARSNQRAYRVRNGPQKSFSDVSLTRRRGPRLLSALQSTFTPFAPSALQPLYQASVCLGRHSFFKELPIARNKPQKTSCVVPLVHSIPFQTTLPVITEFPFLRSDRLTISSPSSVARLFSGIRWAWQSVVHRHRSPRGGFDLLSDQSSWRIPQRFAQADRTPEAGAQYWHLT
jgi:hypothetical protein